VIALAWFPLKVIKISIEMKNLVLLSIVIH
jgi:hypothetical protein